MSPVLRRVLAILSGVGVGGFVLAMVETLGIQLFSTLSPMALEDPEALVRTIQTEQRVLVGVVAAWYLGPLVGAWIATAVADRMGRSWGGIVTAFFLVASLWNLFAIPHPAWFWVVGLGAVAVGGHTGWVLGVRTVRARRRADGGNGRRPNDRDG